MGDDEESVEVEVAVEPLTEVDEVGDTTTVVEVSMTVPLVTLSEDVTVVVEGGRDVISVVVPVSDPVLLVPPVDKFTDCLFSRTIASSLFIAREVTASPASNRLDVIRCMIMCEVILVERET